MAEFQRSLRADGIASPALHFRSRSNRVSALSASRWNSHRPTIAPVPSARSLFQRSLRADGIATSALPWLGRGNQSFSALCEPME